MQGDIPCTVEKQPAPSAVLSLDISHIDICVSLCVANVLIWVCAHAHMLLEARGRCQILSQVTSTLCSETGSLTEPEADQFG